MSQAIAIDTAVAGSKSETLIAKLAVCAFQKFLDEAQTHCGVVRSDYGRKGLTDTLPSAVGFQRIHYRCEAYKYLASEAAKQEYDGVGCGRCQV